VYFLKQKSEATDAFKTFKVLVEKQSGCLIKALKIDKGQEYLVDTNFFQQQGIQHQLTTSYTTQQNGVAERNNRKIMDMVRCMLKASQMPKEFWAASVATAVYILNRCLTKSVQEKTPEEPWSGRRPSIRYLLVFGCISYAHVPYKIINNLDDKGERCIFIGYSSNSKAYKLYNPEIKRMIISRDVTFDEGGMWNWSSKSIKEPIVTLNGYKEEAGQVDTTLDKLDQPETSNKEQRNQRLLALTAGLCFGYR